MKLFSKNSNLCDHNSPTSQTDRQTTCDRNTALCTKVHRAVKMIILNCKVQSTVYLERIVFVTLTTQRLRGDVTEVFKMFTGLENIDYTKLR